ncbi:chemotaxis protein [Streptococcus iners]|uniref:Chemotaxis protein n=1 Tax=Streptococcus iners TaxID=3028084 RepID=A0AA96VJ24_9STRE|nr:chemotaxis protein [Streptococcus sp. 29887]MCK3904784.1 chemotaxis protein [Streptococcus suis]MCK4025386.1 chemotaxis protein [Streptococcus suis]WNY50800.1 chemotaxis protein [Streptococcus sp. 29887]
MKLRNLLLALSAASATYLAISNREKIAKEVKDTKQIMTDMETSKANIQEQLAIIQSFKEPLESLANDLQYKSRVYQQSITGNLEEIQKVMAKYKKED